MDNGKTACKTYPRDEAENGGNAGVAQWQSRSFPSCPQSPENCQSVVKSAPEAGVSDQSLSGSVENISLSPSAREEQLAAALEPLAQAASDMEACYTMHLPDEITINLYLGDARRARAALSSPVEAVSRESVGEFVVPKGYKLVPVELTDEMAKAGAKGRQNSAISSFRDGWKFALAAAPAAPAILVKQGAGEEREVQWEVWEDDMMVASSTSEADANHYLAVYSQDGPMRLVRAETIRSEVRAVTPAPERGGGDA